MRKLFFLLTLATLAATPVTAQNDPEASVKALNYVIRNINPVKGADRLVEEICKKFKNDPKVLVGIAESYYQAGDSAYAYYQAGDSAYAHKFFDRAIASDAQYIPTYITAGDWARDRYGKDGFDEAKDWYSKAIKINPKDSTAYIRYAKIQARQGNLEDAANKIKEILTFVPDFPVNLQIARIYSDAGKVNEAMEFYGKEKIDNLPPSDLREYATLCYLLGKNDVAKMMWQLRQQNLVGRNILRLIQSTVLVCSHIERLRIIKKQLNGVNNLSLSLMNPTLLLRICTIWQTRILN